ncbi:MAG: DUF1624 domain-containing protein [Tabrizicola sp.]|nr:DUF1624 domain-containing protein [Tabrizicola sp.]
MQTAPGSRIVLLDLARTLAVIGMVIFHFTFDLQHFGHIAPDTTFQPFWYYFARLVAGSFLFLAGISLWLAHGRGIRWPAFWRRFAMVAGGAALVSVASIWVTPNGLILFGILHAIAVCSLIGLLFLRLPAALTILGAAAVFALPWWVQSPALNAVWLVPLGLAETRPSMADYVPVFPWLAPLLMGLALARIADGAGLLSRLTGWPGQSPLLTRLSFPGRHSLIIYLLHQPILIAGFMAAAMLSRP